MAPWDPQRLWQTLTDFGVLSLASPKLPAPTLALTPPDPSALAPLSQAWERGWG
jgi:hypothetical protein